MCEKSAESLLSLTLLEDRKTKAIRPTVGSIAGTTVLSILVEVESWVLETSYPSGWNDKNLHQLEYTVMDGGQAWRLLAIMHMAR